MSRLPKNPKIMGILNVTPDSFYQRQAAHSDGGRFDDVSRAVERAYEMVAQGADIIDIGGESTRPGAAVVESAQEVERVVPVIEALKGIDAEISVDTRKPDVARASVAAGASIWNDVTALTFDNRSPSVAAELGCKIVLMHMRGTPETMQDNPHYKDVVAEVMAYLEERVDRAVKAGVRRENIIIDPGIGFGKRLEDNLGLLQHLDDFHQLGCPVLLGASRKSFIGMIDGSTVNERLGGSIASALWGASMGASILRVHDVKETAQAVGIWRAIGEYDNDK